MDKELEIVIERQSWEYAKSCNGICKKMEEWLERNSSIRDFEHEPCELCKEPCKGYSEKIDHANGAKWMAEVIGQDLYSKYFCQIIRRDGGY